MWNNANFAFLLICAASLLTACSGSSQTYVPLQDSEQAQFDRAMPAPDGVNPTLWDELLAELDRSISFAPKVQPARIMDLAPEWLPDGQVLLHWEYSNPGDYDLNGEVNVADLVPVGIYFGATSESENWPAARAADGDGNGEVNVADITPIGAGFRNAVDAYYVFGGEMQPNGEIVAAKGVPAGDFGELLATQQLTEAWVPPEGGLPIFAVIVGYRSLRSYYWVFPIDQDSPRTGFDDFGIKSVPQQVATDLRGDWYMQYRDASHSNRSALSGPSTGTVKWQVKIAESGLGGPVYDADGLIYVGAEDGLHAINPDGTQAWVYQTNEPVESTAAVGPNGAVYFGCNDGVLRAVSSFGDFLWSVDGDGPIDIGVAVGDNGRIYCTSGANELLAMLPTGHVLWRYASYGGIIDTPSIGQDGTIYATANANEIVSTTYYGTDRWDELYFRFQTYYFDWTEWSPVLAVYPTYSDTIEDYMDYFLGEVALFACTQPNYGGRLVMFPIDDDPYSIWGLTTPWRDYAFVPEFPLPPTIRDDFSMVVPQRDSALSAYDLETNLLWTFEYPTNNICSYPVSLSAQGNIYMSVFNRFDQYDKAALIAVDSMGQKLWQTDFEVESLSQPVIAPDKTVYVLASDGVLYSIGDLPAQADAGSGH
jgi:hypothetical protein